MSPALVPAGCQHAPVIAALHAATIGTAPANAGPANAMPANAMPANAGPAGEGWSAAWIARLLALPGAFATLCLAPDPVGFALCLPAGDAVDLVAIGVVASHRRRGIAARLLADCGARAHAAGAERLMLDVAADNRAALALYRRAGFAAVGRRPRYYRAAEDGMERDALVFSKTL
jgi:ribosomal-protein-alanine N-acetyltransferase